ncbi:hypothetical protein NCAS_0B03050 [Naumovozyma castellii]|uniref:Deacetylase sirtuin-type domain-containing protein n=1 Tax=Naumovozyma castellii TaxID=27288 RepID=G0VBR3_NAUCA|nr:hypothetical protein NCAS_0B03050 [Naumovozyma castellii CBS 4309]CCC68389.1 hypothetical protein NCAS_0B03050 [Naumovozyma castellii CBS 4309]
MPKLQQQQLPLTPPPSTIKVPSTSATLYDLNSIDIKPKRLITQLKKLSPRKPPLRYRPIENTILSLRDYQDGLIKPSNKELKFLQYALTHCQRIVVIAGAGISTHAGIPDFRSSSKSSLLMNNSTKSLFDYNYVYSDNETTLRFNTLMNKLNKMSREASPTKFHTFLNELASQGRLLRSYTQNIDGLENKLDDLREKTIQLHGDVNLMSCTLCHKTSPYDSTLFKSNTSQNGSLVPDCTHCMEMQNMRREAGLRNRSIGKLRPKVILYNELHPDGEEIAKWNRLDVKKVPDCLIIVGTTLRIPGVINMVKAFAEKVRSRKNGIILLITNEPPSQRILKLIGNTDLVVLGDCQELPNLIQWKI